MNFFIHHKTFLSCCVVSALAVSSAYAQFTFSGQLRTRSEYRNGQGTLLKESDRAAFFTSQRTRVSAAYSGYRIKAFATLQDVRVWGQDASTINRTTNADLNGLLLHEAWGEFSLLDTAQTKLGKELSLKIGRQELVYDDVRLLGNLDWLQQGRRHDMALLKYGNKGWMLHAGVAYNQNRELKSGTIYNGTPTGYTAGTNGIGTAYKSLQFAYLGKKFSAGSASFLIIKDDFNQYVTTPSSGTVAATRTYSDGTWSRVTLGSYVNATVKKLGVKAEAYYQTGRDKDGRTISAYLLSGSLTYATSQRTAITVGEDYTSGNEPGNATTSTNRRFDPLYGTPHKHWGYMDYFYVADGFGVGGLSDFYLKVRYKPLDRLTMSLDFHQFASTNTIVGTDKIPLSKPSFGQEYDFIAQYAVTKQIGLEGGYSVFSATDALAAAKAVSNADKSATWGYLMVNLKF
ncbi:alginate export family protein [Spirosoma taeanense]|uniref:Alginate export family protein n=1 Tax=Spirosoma taeanense TaxID=2735870 RepID=A0A6M5YES8_9BACT|nr:alginate export family protein [Spirosoma taeanense]QJW91816.1 alginate export family protein [Spirosoma taeanense]